MKKFVLVSIIAFFGVSESQSAEASDLVVVAGGRGSCAVAGNPGSLNMWPKAKAHVQYLNDVKVIRVCWGIDRHFANFDVVESRSGWRRHSSQRQSRHNAINTIANIINRSHADRVTLIGQSYGGWLVSQVALKIASDRVRLFTVDPISPNNCGIGKFLFGGCRGFPQDVASNYSRVNWQGYWVNFYQTAYRRLSSGPSPYAQENIHLPFPRRAGGMFGAHKLTETDGRIWSRFSRSLRQ